MYVTYNDLCSCLNNCGYGCSRRSARYCLDDGVISDGEVVSLELIDMITDEDVSDWESDVVMSVFFENIISDIRDILSSKEFDIICFRFGIPNSPAKTVDKSKWGSNTADCNNALFKNRCGAPLSSSDIGKLYGVTGMRIRQIEKNAISKIRGNPKFTKGYFRYK